MIQSNWPNQHFVKYIWRQLLCNFQTVLRCPLLMNSGSGLFPTPLDLCYQQCPTELETVSQSRQTTPSHCPCCYLGSIRSWFPNFDGFATFLTLLYSSFTLAKTKGMVLLVTRPLVPDPIRDDGSNLSKADMKDWEVFSFLATHVRMRHFSGSFSLLEIWLAGHQRIRRPIWKQLKVDQLWRMDDMSISKSLTARSVVLGNVFSKLIGRFLWLVSLCGAPFKTMDLLPDLMFDGMVFQKKYEKEPGSTRRLVDLYRWWTYQFHKKSWLWYSFGSLEPGSGKTEEVWKWKEGGWTWCGRANRFNLLTFGYWLAKGPCST